MTESGLRIYMVVAKGKERLFCSLSCFHHLSSPQAGVLGLWHGLLAARLTNSAIHWLHPQAHSAHGAFRN